MKDKGAGTEVGGDTARSRCPQTPAGEGKRRRLDGESLRLPDNSKKGPIRSQSGLRSGPVASRGCTHGVCPVQDPGVPIVLVPWSRFSEGGPAPHLHGHTRLSELQPRQPRVLMELLKNTCLDVPSWRF